MSLENKVFRDNQTGKTVKVISSFENIAILENRDKIDVRTLMDTSKYTEDNSFVDPSSFFNNQVAYNALAEKIKTISTDGIIDEDLASKFGSEVRPAIEESAIIMSSEEDEIAELARKYGAVEDNSATIRQHEAFSKILDEDEMPPIPQVQTRVIDEPPVQRFDINGHEQVEEGREYIQPPVQRVQVDDPITSMFRNVKRNVSFKMNVEISNKIPRLDFIEMMEDSYEISIIDFLAEEFTNNLLSEPEKVKEMIKDRIKQIVYGWSTEPKVDEVEKKETVKKTSKTRTIPKVSKEETEQLNEGVEKKQPPSPPKPPRSRKLKEGAEPEKPNSMK
jgi:hypothetical protein